MAAEGKVGLMMNVPRERLSQVLSLLPALQKPTVSSLADEAWVDVNTVLDEAIVRHIIPRLKAAGARGIVEYPLNKVID
jgi:ATP phosphoribosyltransferase